MARKPSVILSATERKQAAADIAAEIKSTKEQLKAATTDVKNAEKQVKELSKTRDSIAKTLVGLETRKAALAPAKAPQPLVG